MRCFIMSRDRVATQAIFEIIKNQSRGKLMNETIQLGEISIAVTRKGHQECPPHRSSARMDV